MIDDNRVDNCNFDRDVDGDNNNNTVVVVVVVVVVVAIDDHYHLDRADEHLLGRPEPEEEEKAQDQNNNEDSYVVGAGRQLEVVDVERVRQ